MTDVTSAHGLGLLASAPRFYEQSNMFKSVMQANGTEFDTLDVAIKEAADQAFIDTASYSMPVWEARYGIPTDNSLTLEERRGKVLAKMRGVGTVDAALISSVVESYGWGKVHVEQDFESCEVTVIFQQSKGIPPNDTIMKRSVEEVLPAHIGLLWLYLFMTWDELDGKDLTWDQLDSMGLSWEEFEVQ